MQPPRPASHPKPIPRYRQHVSEETCPTGRGGHDAVPREGVRPGKRYQAIQRAPAFARAFDLRAHRRLRSSWRPAVYPSVNVFLPVCVEPLEVLHNTWTHVATMARPYQGVVTPYVLDDGGNRAVAAMAANFGFVYSSRPHRGWFKK